MPPAHRHPWDRQTRRAVKGRAGEAALPGARLGTRAGRKAQEKGEAGDPLSPRGDPGARETPWSPRCRSTDLTGWPRIDLEVGAAPIRIVQGALIVFLHIPCIVRKMGTWRRGRETAIAVCVHPRLRLYTSLSNPFPLGKKSREVGEQEF